MIPSMQYENLKCIDKAQMQIRSHAASSWKNYTNYEIRSTKLAEYIKTQAGVLNILEDITLQKLSGTGYVHRIQHTRSTSRKDELDPTGKEK